jgi:hypothetical protein
MVYMSVNSGGFGGVSLSTYGTISAGTVPILTTVSVYVPANVSITVNYVNTGVLTWHWIPV